MPFFIPCQCKVGDPYFDRIQTIIELTKSEYFDSVSTDDQEGDKKLAKTFNKERELAFFLVNIGVTLHDYLTFTDVEKMFLRKAYEEKIVFETTMIRNAVLNAKANAERKHRSKFIELFKKKPKKIDKEMQLNNMEEILHIENSEGKNWIDLIYKNSGFTRIRKGDK